MPLIREPAVGVGEVVLRDLADVDVVRNEDEAPAVEGAVVQQQTGLEMQLRTNRWSIRPQQETGAAEVQPMASSALGTRLPTRMVQRWIHLGKTSMLPKQVQLLQQSLRNPA